MNCSKVGQFYGTTNETIHLDGVTLTDTVYGQDRVPWHFHEHNYFTFILQGGVIEGNKKHVYECCTGDLLFHNWQDAHYNIASGRFTRGVHVEVSPQWFDYFDKANNITEGSIRIADPRIKMLMYQVVKEMKLAGNAGQLSIDTLVLEIFGLLTNTVLVAGERKPQWVSRVREILHESKDDWKLADLARSVNIHPVHLSRHFSKYFGMSLGDYVRAIKVQRALTLLPNDELSLTDISFECGFADQSHFIRSFKSFYQVTPLHYRKFLLKK
ncbi:MAG: helix-turn-helix domain-containing protein [Niastella sp.]|nr:helix-turn-helix domain-containing protein [Niastella sp.]